MRRTIGCVAVLALIVAAGLTFSGLRGKQDEAAMPEGASASPETIKATEHDAMTAAKKTDRQIEVASARTERTSTYANPDGTYTREEHQQPIRVFRNGRWLPVDADIVKSGNGRLTPKATTMPVTFSGGGDEPLATLSRSGRSLSLTWPGPLPTPVVDGSRATYRNVLPDVDLVVNSDVNSFSHVLVVKTAEAAKHPSLREIALGVRTERMSLTVRDGRLVATDAGSGGTMFVAPQPTMWDSGVGANLGETLDPARYAPETSRQSPVGIKLTGDRLVLSPDAKMLADPALHYPIYIDPQWSSDYNSNRTLVDSGYPYNEYWDWAGRGNATDQRVGKCPRDTSVCNSSDVTRIFFIIPTSTYLGSDKQILQANFNVTLKWVENPTNAYGTQLWRTGGVDGATNWAYQPGGVNWDGGSYLGTTTSMGTQACGQIQRNLSMDATQAIREANANGWGATTFGMKSDTESSYRAMRRFCNDAFISVRYNKKPNVATNLTSDPGAGCVTGSSRPYVPRLPVLKATASDPDTTAEPLSVQFTVTWTPPGGGPQTHVGETVVKNGGEYEYNLANAGITIPENVVVSWKTDVSDWDGGTRLSWSGYSGSCEFILDATKPLGPDVDSPQYLPADAGDTTPACLTESSWHDGVGSYGSFTFDSASTDVTAYKYQFTGASGTSTLTSVSTIGGGPVTIQWRPSAYGPHTLTVYSVDGALQESAGASCVFGVTQGRSPIAEYALTDPAGSSQAVDSSDAANPATRGSGVTFGAEGPDGVLGGAATFDGSGNAYLTSAKVNKVNTAKPFTVSAWVKATTNTRYQTILSQDGVGEPGFSLGINGGSKKWFFHMPLSDVEANVGIWQVSSSSDVVVDKWTHLVAGFDPIADQIWLQVDKGTVVTAPNRSNWGSHGNLHIGRRTAKTGYTWNFQGSIASARVFDRWASADDAGYIRRVGRTGYWPLDEITTGTTKGYAADGVTVELAKALTVNGDTALRQPVETCDEELNCIIDPSDLMGGRNPYIDLDGSGDFLNSPAHLVGLKGSFTVAIRARLAPFCDAGEQTVLSQPGTNRSRFTLSCANNQWRAFFATGDDTGTGGITLLAEAASALPESESGIGQHIALTYDYDHQTATLYINGQVATTGTATGIPTWNGTFDGGIQVGRAQATGTTYGNYFSGDMDEIRVYSGVLTQDEIQLIASTTVVRDK